MIKRKNIFELNNKNSFDEQQLVSSMENLNNNDKRIILIDAEEDLFLPIRYFYRKIIIM